MVVRPALGETRCVASAVTPVRAPTSPRGSRLAMSRSAVSVGRRTCSPHRAVLPLAAGGAARRALRRSSASRPFHNFEIGSVRCPSSHGSISRARSSSCASVYRGLAIGPTTAGSRSRSRRSGVMPAYAPSLPQIVLSSEPTVTTGAAIRATTLPMAAATGTLPEVMSPLDEYDAGRLLASVRRTLATNEAAEWQTSELAVRMGLSHAHDRHCWARGGAVHDPAVSRGAGCGTGRARDIRRARDREDGAMGDRVRGCAPTPRMVALLARCRGGGDVRLCRLVRAARRGCWTVWPLCSRALAGGRSRWLSCLRNPTARRRMRMRSAWRSWTFWERSVKRGPCSWRSMMFSG